jgi:hypothetical protein
MKKVFDGRLRVPSSIWKELLWRSSAAPCGKAMTHSAGTRMKTMTMTSG